MPKILRTDFLEFVSPNSKRVLSVGCSNGAAETALVEQGMHVVGIEINSQAAKKAQENGLEVLIGDAASVSLEHFDKPFDYLMYADVLEHLADPLTVLSSHLKYLKTGGGVFVCVPNFRHYSVFLSLFVKGLFKYKDSGIFDKTHIRLTTRKMVLSWFQQAGLETTLVRYQIKRTRHKIFSLLTLGLMKDFFAVQIILIGEKR